MYLVVMGGGTAGLPLISSMVAAGHEVFVIDNDPARVSVIEKKLGNIATVGNGASAAVLRAAGVSRAGMFIATTSSDADNLAACQLAKSNFNVPRTIAVAATQENAELFRLAGVDVVVSSSELVVANLAGALPAHPMVRLMPLMGREQEIVAIKVPAGAAIVGMQLKEISLPYGVHVSLIVGSDGRAETAGPDTVIEGEDDVIAVTPVEASESLWETLTELR